MLEVFGTGATMGDPNKTGIGKGRVPKNSTGIPSSLQAKPVISGECAASVVANVISSFDSCNKQNSTIHELHFKIISFIYFIGFNLDYLEEKNVPPGVPKNCWCLFLFLLWGEFLYSVLVYLWRKRKI